MNSILVFSSRYFIDTFLQNSSFGPVSCLSSIELQNLKSAYFNGYHIIHAWTTKFVICMIIYDNTESGVFWKAGDQIFAVHLSHLKVKNISERFAND